MDAPPALKALDRTLRPVSWGTLGVLGILVLLKHGGFWLPPGWLESLVMPVLTGAAVGYLTNFIAIEMLFKPYRPTDRHWLRYATLGFWKQGLVPGNKERIGRVMGEVIPQNLVNPEELATELGRAATELFQNETFLAALREGAQRFVGRYSGNISSFLIPHIEEAVKNALADNLTPENIARFWDELAVRYLENPENREALAAAIIGELRNRSPELAQLIRENLKEGVRDYLRAKLGALPRMLVPADFAAGLVDYLDWKHIERRLAEKLGDAAGRELIKKELAGFTLRIRDYLKTAEGEAKVRAFLAENGAAMEEFLRAYLAAKLPELTATLLNSPEFWKHLEEQLLPGVARSIALYLRTGGKREIVARLDLQNRIERAVAAQDVEEFHGMITAIAAEHLVAIQVLGYFLGAAAGILLAAVNL